MLIVCSLFASLINTILGTSLSHLYFVGHVWIDFVVACFLFEFEFLVNFCSAFYVVSTSTQSCSSHPLFFS